jgi:hypothetical protein
VSISKYILNLQNQIESTSRSKINSIVLNAIQEMKGHYSLKKSLFFIQVCEKLSFISKNMKKIEDCELFQKFIVSFFEK